MKVEDTEGRYVSHRSIFCPNDEFAHTDLQKSNNLAFTQVDFRVYSLIRAAEKALRACDSLVTVLCIGGGLAHLINY